MSSVKKLGRRPDPESGRGIARDRVRVYLQNTLGARSTMTIIRACMDWTPDGKVMPAEVRGALRDLLRDGQAEQVVDGRGRPSMWVYRPPRSLPVKPNLDREPAVVRRLSKRTRERINAARVAAGITKSR